MNRNAEILYLVVPCYNEEEMLPISVVKINEKLEELIILNKISDKSKIMLVDDGSKDKTWEVIEALNNEYKKVTGIRNNFV